jgi:hypothetical protein
MNNSNGNLNTLADFAPWVNAKLKKRAARTDKLQLSGSIRQWLTGRDRLLRDQNDNRPYLLDDDGSAIPLDTDGLALQSALARAGFNPSESAFAWLLADLRTGAYDAGRIIRLSRWAEHAGGMVRVSCGGRSFVLAIAGAEPLLCANGECGIVFANDTSIPVWNANATPVASSDIHALNPPLQAPTDVPDYTPDVQRALLAAWLAGLVAGIRPLPILAALGARDSGKSWLARGILRTFLGLGENVTPLPDDPRDFQTLAVRSPLFALDNLDKRNGCQMCWQLSQAGEAGKVVNCIRRPMCSRPNLQPR